jgi:signal transduction histidine kinase
LKRTQPLPEPLSGRLTLPGIERRNWWLWALTFSLLVVLALAVLFFSVSSVSEAARRFPYETTIQVLLASLLGLILLFCLYLILKQRELGVLRQRLFEEYRQTGILQAHVGTLTSLLEAAATLGSHLDLGTILDGVVGRVTRAVGAEECAVFLWDAERERFVCRAASGPGADALVGAEAPADPWLTRWPEGAAPLVAAAGDGSEQSLLPGRQAVVSSMTAPLHLQGKVRGLLYVDRSSDEGPFGESQVRLLAVFAALVAGGVERAELYEGLDRRARSLEDANRKLRELNEFKEMFLTTVSHELKTPITGILACADVLSYDELEASRRKEFSGRLVQQGRVLIGLIEDLMDLSRLRLGLVRLNVARLRVNDVVTAALVTAGATVAERGLTLEYEPDPGLGEADMDETKIVQVVLNLVGNAAKFTARGGRIDVSTRSDGDAFEIAVADTGSGIPAEHVDRIFEAFTRVEDPRTPKTRGMGVGLHLVKQIVELHGGRVQVTSQVGVGSIFRCRFPLDFATPDAGGLGCEEHDTSHGTQTLAA